MSEVAAVTAQGRTYFIGGSLGAGVVSATATESGLSDFRDETALPVALQQHVAVAY